MRNLTYRFLQFGSGATLRVLQFVRLHKTLKMTPGMAAGIE
jgi:hypothetical protein